MLRGAQTPGELKQRTERMHGFADLAAVQEVLERLIERGFVVRHPRRPGQKEDRYEQVLGGGEAEDAGARPPSPPQPRSTRTGQRTTASRSGDEEFVSVAEDPTPAEAAEEVDRLDRLETELLDLKGEIARLREALGD